MNASFFRFFRLSTLALAALLLAGRANAVTISASVVMPPLNFANIQFTEFNPTIATFNFQSSPNWGLVDSVNNVSITLSFFNLDTNGPPGTGLDYNNISLALGGYNTGILLNGFGNSTDTVSFNASTANAVGIVNALNTNNGILVASLIDATLPPTYQSNPFWFAGGTATLSFTDAVVTPLPFTPAPTLGFGLIGLCVAVRRLRQRGGLMALFSRA